MEASEPQASEVKSRRPSTRFLLCLLGFAIAAGSLLMQWLGLPSSVEIALFGLGSLVFGASMVRPMFRVAADNWAAAGAARRLWLAFAVTITVIMVIGAVGMLIGGVYTLVSETR